MSNHLQILVQRQYIFFSYFKTLSVGLVSGLNPRPPTQKTGTLQTGLGLWAFHSIVCIFWVVYCQSVYTKTVDSVEGMLWLACQTANVLCYLPPSLHLWQAKKSSKLIFCGVYYVTVSTASDLYLGEWLLNIPWENCFLECNCYTMS